MIVANSLILGQRSGGGGGGTFIPIPLKVVTKTGTYDAVTADLATTFLFDLAGNATLLLPSAPQASGWWIQVGEVLGALGIQLLINPNGLLLDGLAVGQTVSPSASAVIFSDGSNYFLASGEVGIGVIGQVAIYDSVGSVIGTDRITCPAIQTPAAPTVVPNTTGATSYTYYVQYIQSNIVFAQSAPITITNGNAAPNNTISWPALPGAEFYVVVNSVTTLCSLPVSGLSVTDTGAWNGQYFMPTESGYLDVQNGIHIGALSYDTYGKGYISSSFFVSDLSKVSIISLEDADAFGINVGLWNSAAGTHATAGAMQFTGDSASPTTQIQGVGGFADLWNTTGTPVCWGIAANATGGNAGSGNAAEVSGMFTSVDNWGSGTITLMTGLHVASAINSGTVSELDGVLINDQSAAGGTLTATYGLHITSQTASTPGSTKWAIKVDGGVSEFDGPMVQPLANAPANAGSTGTAGQIAWDATHVYICTATNTWVRNTVPFATW
jgi:hypothetical protein